MEQRAWAVTWLTPGGVPVVEVYEDDDALRRDRQIKETQIDQAMRYPGTTVYLGEGDWLSLVEVVVTV